MTAWPAALKLPHAAPARVLGCGAFLKNTACLIDGTQAQVSPLHDDLSDPAACAALEASVDRLLARCAGGRVEALAHDRHPDFHSSRVAQRVAGELGVPAIGIQHHHAHVAVVQAEQGWTREPVIGLALDGVGLGDDGTSWGGEVLLVRGATSTRVAHLPVLALPGGDVAAREPWRMAAAALHALGRGDEIERRFASRVGTPLARGVATMLARDLNCPRSSAAGRWFDAAAGALGLSLRQAHEAEAAIALEQAAACWLADRPAVGEGAAAAGADGAGMALDLLPQLGALFDADAEAARDEAAARFHLALAAGFVAAAVQAARAHDAGRVVLGGGCFFNRILSGAIEHGLRHAGLRVVRPQAVSVGDAGLALGQAWAAALALADGATA